ncbi:hypothetical protein F4820DRAFT_153002 [Hypoxylon rubiginosum]|uniref:Uncharacterized protein n=1 Tax=Hypoxylon rubiginosum TaxID=110542 RepID=A0ACB9Z9V7_9PEZI|nr:hypothetical protein F4820DRAFT_153002 [Hypoxylon rubiginosum]
MDPSRHLQDQQNDVDLIIPGQPQQRWRPNLPHHFYPSGVIPSGVMPQPIEPDFRQIQVQVLPPAGSHDALSNLASAAAISDAFSVSPTSPAGPPRLHGQDGPSAFVGSEELTAGPSVVTAQQREQTRARRRVPNSQRKRTQVSCDACKTRRCKCVRLGASSETEAAGDAGRPGDLPPCKLCVETGIRCVTTMPRKQRVYGSVENLDKRYRALEALVSGLFLDLDSRASAEELVAFGRERGIAMPDFSESADQPQTPSAEQQSVRSNQSESSARQSAKGKRPSLVVTGTDADRMILPPAYLMRVNPGATPQTPPDAAVDGIADPSTERTGLILDATGRPHYVGPSGSLAFFAKMRELFSQRFGAIRSPDDPEREGGQLGRDRTGQLTNNPLAQSLGGTGDRGRAGGSPSEHEESPGHQNLDHLDGDSPPRICEDMLREHPDDPEFWRYRKRVSTLNLPQRDRADACVEAFFRNVHPNFILFHRLTFQSAYEKMWRCWEAHRSSRSKDERAKEISVSVGWLCCLYMIFILGSRSLPQTVNSLEFQRKWFAQVDKLPPLLGTSSLPNVCAYMLFSLYYHNTNDRTSAWTFHGAACRLSIALGMHRESSSDLFDPLERQLRKLVWWTSYDYEQFLCCSLGRPSAIDDREMDVGIPNDDYLDANLTPPCYIQHSARLNMLLAAIRRGIFDPGFVPGRMYSRALEFLEAAACWEDDLPRGLRPVPFEASYGNANQWRNALMLHVRYYHALTFLTRPFLFETIQSVNGDEPLGPDARKVRALSKTCLTAAMRCGELIITLWRAGQLNGVTWIDIYYAYMSCLDISLALLSPESLHQDEEHPEVRRPGLILKYTTNEMKGVVRQLCDAMTTIELCGTNARFAKAAFEFASVLGIIPAERILSLRMQVSDSKAMAAGEDPNEGKHTVDGWKEAQGVLRNREQEALVSGLDQGMSGMHGYYPPGSSAMNLDFQENIDTLPADFVQWDM